MTPDRRQGGDRRQVTLGPPEGECERRHRRDRRGSHRRTQIREGAAWVCAVAALLLAGWGAYVAGESTEDAAEANRIAADATAAARVTADRVAAQADQATRDNALSSFQGCRRANRETRPAARAGLLVLRDLVAAVNAGATGDLPPAFRDAPAKLEDALRKLAPTDCPAAYPAGYVVWIEEGRPAP